MKRRILSREEADLTLREIAVLRKHIEREESVADRITREAREAMIERTAEARKQIAAHEHALREWAKSDRRHWPAKSLELNFGVVGWRLGKPAIKLVVAMQTVVERLRARKMISCIRVVEELDKEALAAYDDETIDAVGCRRTQPKEKFWYEIKREEIK